MKVAKIIVFRKGNLDILRSGTSNLASFCGPGPLSWGLWRAWGLQVGFLWGLEASKLQTMRFRGCSKASQLAGNYSNPQAAEPWDCVTGYSYD